jgi:hypothetical protein
VGREEKRGEGSDREFKRSKPRCNYTRRLNPLKIEKNVVVLFD